MKIEEEKKIMKFLGYELCFDDLENAPSGYYYKPSLSTNSDEWSEDDWEELDLGYPAIEDVSQLQFDNNWNHLMFLIDRIETLETEFDGRFGVYIHSNCCSIQSTKLDTRPESPHYSFAIFDICLNTKIESVYYAVICFIRYYNENKLKFI